MKIKKVEAILLRKKIIFLYNTDKEQYIGNQNAIYPLYGFPVVDEDSIYMMFDISKEKRKKILFTQFNSFDTGISMDSSAEGEIQVERCCLQIMINSTPYEPIYTSRGIRYIDSRLLDPYCDEEYGIQLYERINEHSDTVYFAVKTGFTCVGIIFPEKMFDRALANSITEIAEATQKLVAQEDQNDKE